MAWASIALAAAALVAAPLYRTVAVLFLVLAFGLISIEFLRGERTVVHVAAAIITVLATAVTGWSIVELNRSEPTTMVDEAAYERAAEGTRDVFLPFVVTQEDITAVALLEFEKNSDPVYSGFEPQLIERPGETGMRIIGYRNDGAADFYDDVALTPEENFDSGVIGSGVNEYTSVAIEKQRFEVDDEGRFHVSAEFRDVEGRDVVIDISEGSTNRVKPFDLLAPVGHSSQNPDLFPYFFLNDFDFLRTGGGANMKLTINGEPRPLQGFPVPIPIQGEMRSFAKYSLDVEIIEVFPARTPGRWVRTEPGRDTVVLDGVTYLFAGQNLERIRINDHEITFDPALDLTASSEGTFAINSYPARGSVAGPYAVEADGETGDLGIRVTEVELPAHRDVGVRMLTRYALRFLKEWPQGYEYRAEFDLSTGSVEPEWINHTPATK